MGAWRSLSLSLATSLLPIACWAQVGKPPGPSASATARTGAPAASAAAATAMERAQRAADSPLRAILEASKPRRRVDSDGPAEGLQAARRGAEAVAPVAGPDSPVTTIRTLPGEALPGLPERSAGLATAAVEPLRDVSAPALAANLLPPVRPPTAAGTGASQPPELVRMVEPEMTPRLLDLLVRPEVAVEFTILPDGSVSGVQVQPPVARAVATVIAEAVVQWRFAPVPAPRRHRVQLVFQVGG